MFGRPSYFRLSGRLLLVKVRLARVVIINVAGLTSVLASVLSDVSLAWSKSTSLQEIFSLHSLHVSHSCAGLPSSARLATRVLKAGPGVDDEGRVLAMQ